MVVETAFSLGKNIYKKTEKQPDYFGLRSLNIIIISKGIKAE